MLDWLWHLFHRPPPPARNGHVERLETETARLVARLEALQIRVELPSRRAGDDERGNREAGRETSGR